MSEFVELTPASTNWDLFHQSFDSASGTGELDLPRCCIDLYPSPAFCSKPQEKCGDYRSVRLSGCK